MTEMFYSIPHLIKADWFPHKRYGIDRLINQGKLKAVDLKFGTVRRLRITKQSVDEYLNALNNGEPNSQNIA